MIDSTNSEEPSRDKSQLRRTAGFAIALLLSFLAIWFLSPPFEYGSALKRPILIVTGLLLLSSVFAFLGLVNAIKISSQRQLMILIVGIAISARLVALFTCPILEIDYYRYMWNGKVLAEGISPYRYSPKQILEPPPIGEADLESLNSLSVRSESNHTILSRIHFENHTTIYPPVSQAVFCATMIVVPESASVEAHIIAMKFVLVLFEIGTLILVLVLLSQLKIHCGWLIVYAWNPLVIKEVANGGHLDSIATFFTVLSVYTLAKWYLSESQRQKFVVASAVSLGLGVGAKLFPVVIFPALLVALIRKRASNTLWFTLVFIVTVAVSMSPMISPTTNRDTHTAQSQPEKPETNQESSKDDTKTHDGLSSFLSSWRMNDIVFSTVYLNFKDVRRDVNRIPWFVVTSADFRIRFCDWCKQRKIGGDNPAYFATRVITLALFSVFYFWQLGAMLKTRNESEQWVTDFLSRIGWIIFVFLVLQPTVNPWYLLWAAPFFCFSKNPGWLLVSGVLATYYSRFWFQNFSEPIEFGGTIYTQVGIYDFLVIWGAYAVIIAILAGCFAHKRLGGNWAE